jgi:hypothetical protein
MATQITIDKLWFDDNKIFIQTIDGKVLWQSLLWYYRLRFATDEQRNNYRLSYSGIHWADIDEDIALESFLYNYPEPVGIAKIFHQYPELNASAFARRIGINQSLLAAYISNQKIPSQDMLQEIKTAIAKFADQLKEATLFTV